MKNHYFLADLHLNHKNIIKYCNRKWGPPELALTEDKEEIKKLITPEIVKQMNDDLIKNINDSVGKDDMLWILGDFCFGPGEQYVEVAQDFVSKIQCTQLGILWGNHDQPSRIKHLFNISDKNLCVSIDPNSGNFDYDFNVRFKFKKSWCNFFLCHYITASWPDKNKGVVHLYGHSHGGMENWANEHLSGHPSLDVGVDNVVKLVGEYRPLSLKEVIQYSNLRVKC